MKRLLALTLTLCSTLPVMALEERSQSVTIAGMQHAVHLPVGLALEVLNQDLEQPRLLTFAADGTLFIGSRAGLIYRLSPPYDEARVLVRTGGYPHSVALRAGELLIAMTDGLYRAPYTPEQTRLDPERIELLAPLPGGRGHSSRTVTVGPDGRIYVSLGISGNCSDQYIGGDYAFAEQRGGVMVLDETQTPPRWQPYATGLRNPVGLAWQPGTQALYATNNGPDHHGYDEPREVFTRLSQDSFHGMPWFQVIDGKVTRDGCISSEPPRPASAVTLPAATFAARSAPMGVTFVPDGALLPGLAGAAIVALHGSWATQPDGGASGDPASRRPPQLIAVPFVAGQAQTPIDLVTDFQDGNGQRWARPVGVAIGPDGALYFTSDSGTEGLFRLRATTQP